MITNKAKIYVKKIYMKGQKVKRRCLRAFSTDRSLMIRTRAYLQLIDSLLVPSMCLGMTRH